MVKAPSIAQRALIVAVATVLLVLSGTLAWAAVNDYKTRGVVPQGVTVAGTDLGGMTESQARTAIEQAVSVPMLRPVSVQAADKTFTFDPKGIVSVDVDAMLAEAYAPRRTAPIIARVRHDVGGVPLPTTIAPKYSLDEQAVSAWMANVVSQVDTPPLNAERKVVKYELVVRPSAVGLKTDVAGSEKAITDALQAESALSDTSRTVTIPVASIPPKVSEKSFKKTMVVSLSERRLRLYNGAKLEKTYRVAIGTPAHPTPPGDWTIINKRYMPTWTNPGSAWAKSMPPYIPPGPGNPLGTRALDLDASGIRFHGTNKIGSVGTAASHGCMRMYMHDIEDLFPRVPINTPVYIRS